MRRSCWLAASVRSRARYLRASADIKTNIDTQPVMILSVDGRDTTMRRVLVDPGPREIRVQALPVPGGPHGNRDAEARRAGPATRYYIVAVRPNRLDRGLRRAAGRLRGAAGRLQHGTVEEVTAA
ncbi:MAG: hypothetical protein MZW92_40250 [Comamonadaceae bacterium]|nr:hypothetical protein [Comamonadaceae bacterium]